MKHHKSQEHAQAAITRRLLPRDATPSLQAPTDADTSPPAEPLLLPPANPMHYREPDCDEQEIDGYTIAEAQAALDAFKRRRNNQSS